MPDFKNKTLLCKDCGEEFVWSSGEQRFFVDKGLQNIPQRCPGCRKLFKERERPGYEVTCWICGRRDTVRFEPKKGEKVLCWSCFKDREGKIIEQRDPAAIPAGENSEAAVKPAPDEKTETKEIPPIKNG